MSCLETLLADIEYFNNCGLDCEGADGILAGDMAAVLRLTNPEVAPEIVTQREKDSVHRAAEMFEDTVDETDPDWQIFA